MDKYINIMFTVIAQKHKINLITIMSYNKEHKKVTRSYNLTIIKNNKRHSIRVTNKRELILEMMKWVKD